MIRYKISKSGKVHEKRIWEISETGLPEDARIIYEGPRNRLGVVDDTLNVKAFGYPRFPNNYIYTGLRKSKARRSYEHAVKLLELGFDTPEPYGYVEEVETTAGIKKLRRSYYFCRHEDKPNMRLWEGNPELDKLVEQWGAEIARLHKAGVWMKDHSAGNVLLGKDSNENFTFSYVDLNRIKFGVNDDRKLLQMFKSVSTAESFTLQLARAYARAAGKDEEQVASKVKRIFRRFNRHKKK